jgi:XTP/dITP diphosphohydrolase
MKELVLATHNAGKIKELQALLAPICCISQASLAIPAAIENGLSFIENALIKARHASLHSGKPALADDSGLVVPALHGEPGIYSARYAGVEASDTDNIQLLLHNMRNLKGDERSAYFYCAIALVKEAEDPIPVVVTGLVEGMISKSLKILLVIGLRLWRSLRSTFINILSPCK